MNKQNLLRWLLALVGLCVVVASGAWLMAKRPFAQPQLTSQQAAVLALNQITATDAGFELQHPHHSAQFTAEGLHFQALNGPSWQWQLIEATAQDVALGQTAATRPTAAQISYHRGAITEQYLIRAAAIEQQFVLPEPLTLTADDLILTGHIQSDGTFMTTPNGWAWYIDNTTVELGDVTVFDATGALLPAQLEVTATETRLSVDGQALATAVYPVTIDPTITAGEVRISQSGADTDDTIDAFDPAVAYNSTGNEFLVVWVSDESGDGIVELYGARLNPITGTVLGDFTISNTADTYRPAVAYNSTNNQYLVVWQHDGQIESARLDNQGNVVSNPTISSSAASLHPTVAYNSTNNQYLVVWQEEVNPGEFEIVGQRFDNAGTSQGKVTLSTTGTAADPDARAQHPAVAYNSTNNEYLVVWSADATDEAEIEYQIYGQRLNALTGAEVGSDFQISATPDAIQPSVAYSTNSAQYLVAWAGTAESSHQYEIYGRRVSNTATFPANEFQISQVGNEVGSNFDAAHAKVAYNPTEQLFLVVWRADDTTDEDHEIYSAWLDDTSGTVTVDLAAVSSMGPDADGNYQADRPAVAYGTASQKALVVWEGDDDTDALVDNKMEIYGGFVSLAECNAFDTADLTVSISESADPVLAGSGPQNLTYVVTLTNNGPDTACNTNVAINLTLPGNGVTVNATSPSGGTTYISPNWIIGDLPTSSSETLTIKLTVAETAVPATNAITISAGATSDTPLLMTGDDNDSEQTSIISNSFSVSDASIAEGNSGAQSLSFTVNRTNNSIASSVDFATIDVTAVSDTDYIGQSTTVNFGAGGALSQQVTVPINGDTLVELDETFTVNLSNPVNGFIASEGNQATGTITNDDSATINISNVTQSEGNVGQTIFSFALTLSASVDQNVAVGYSTADGTATTADSDYVSKSGSVNFTGTAGETKNIQITVNGDTKVEGNETFLVNLNAPTSGGRTVSLISGSATGTINNDDATTVDFTKSSYTISESAANGTLTVQLSNPSAFTVQVDYASSNGSATAGADYTAVNNTLTFPPGVTSQTINVPILTDGSDEADETVIVTLSNASNATLGTTRNPATLVIVDDDGTPTVNLSSFDFTVGEADGVVTATVSLSSPAGQTIEVDYTTIDGSATGGSDYTAATNTLSFPLNAISQTITISITNDSFNEATESFTLALQNPVNVSLGLVQTSTITIEDDDSPPTVDFEATDFTVLEDGGTAAVDVVLDSPSGQDITVYYTTADDSALAGSDYTAATDAIFIPSGTVTGTISITILDDMTYEPTEAFTLTLTGADNASVSTIPDKTITILDDDPLILPDVSIGDVTADEGDSNTLFTFPITLSLSSSYPTTITYVTADGTALAGADYVASTNTIVIPAGMISGTVSIVVIGDLTAEPAETFEVILTNVENGTITDGTGVGTILNDDPIVLPEVTIGDVTAVEGDVNNPFSFPITLSLASALPTTITYSTADNTASAGEDYIAVDDTIVIPAGVTTATIDVTVIGDVGQELDETFILKIDALENGIIAKGAGTGTILNDDTLILPNASIGDVTAVEGDANNDFVFVVTLDMTSTLPFSVTYNTSNGTATAGSDYTAASGTVMIPAGADTATITVNVIGDTRYEADETFMVVLTGAVNGYIADSVGTATLLNDDDRQLFLPVILR